jgi:L-aspartate oxidase
LIPDLNETQIRNLTWEYCGILRDGDGLKEAIATLDRSQWSQPERLTLAAVELRNIRQVAELIARCALWREESRGAHYRRDFPNKDPEFLKPSRIAVIEAAERPYGHPSSARLP